MGGFGGACPPQESPLPVPCPPGGSGGLRPPGISVNYPCLASAPAVPCPRALPPIFFSSEIFSSEFFRPIFFRLNFFDRKMFRPKILWTRKIRAKKISVEQFFIRIFFVRPSVRRPSVVFDSLSIKKRRYMFNGDRFGRVYHHQLMVGWTHVDPSPSTTPNVE